MAIPSKVGGCIPYDPEIPLQGEDLEKLAHVHRRFARDWALLHSLNVKKNRTSLPGVDQREVYSYNEVQCRSQCESTRSTCNNIGKYHNICWVKRANCINTGVLKKYVIGVIHKKSGSLV